MSSPREVKGGELLGESLFYLRIGVALYEVPLGGPLGRSVVDHLLVGHFAFKPIGHIVAIRLKSELMWAKVRIY